MRVLNENTIFLQQGTVKLVFQPGEEGYAGAYEMLKDEILDDLDGILSVHVFPSIPSGGIGSRPGTVLAGAGLFTVTVHGQGSHAATPHFSKDPVLAASSAVVALQQIVSRELDPLEAGVSLLSTFKALVFDESESWLKSAEIGFFMFLRWLQLDILKEVMLKT
jgi:IAA-amino acid hydrolase